MTAWVVGRHSFALSRLVSPELCVVLSASPSIERGRREDREPAGTRGPRARLAQKTGCTAAYRSSRDIPAFPAQWFDGLCRALPGERCTLAPVALQPCSTRRPGRASRITATAWRQQPDARTTRFCRTPVSPLVVRNWPRSRLGRPAGPDRADETRVHRRPARVRDDRDTPLFLGPERDETYDNSEFW